MGSFKYFRYFLLYKKISEDKVVHTILNDKFNLRNKFFSMIIYLQDLKIIVICFVIKLYLFLHILVEREKMNSSIYRTISIIYF